MPRSLTLEPTPMVPFESEKANEESGINGADEMPLKTMLPIESEKANEPEVEEMPEVKKRKQLVIEIPLSEDEFERMEEDQKVESVTPLKEKTAENPEETVETPKEEAEKPEQCLTLKTNTAKTRNETPVKYQFDTTASTLDLTYKEHQNLKQYAEKLEL